MSISRRALMGGMMLSPVVLAGCAASSTVGATPSAAAAPDWRAFDRYLEQRTTAGWFSGTVLLAENGKPLLTRGYGFADRDRHRLNQPTTKFDICSIGKSFTAVATAQLVGAGKLSFQDAIAKYVVGFRPEVADKVTIHQLLTHRPAWATHSAPAAPRRRQWPTWCAALPPNACSSNRAPR